MKKLLFTLSSLFISTSSVLAVVACSTTQTTNSVENNNEIKNLSFTNSSTKASVLEALQSIEIFKDLKASDVYITIKKSTEKEDGYITIEGAPGSKILIGKLTIVIPKITTLPPIDENTILKLKDYENAFNLNLNTLDSNEYSVIAEQFCILNKNILPDSFSPTDFYVFDITNSTAKVTGKNNNSQNISVSKEDAVNVFYKLTSNSTDPTDPGNPFVPPTTQGSYEQNGEGYYYIQDIPTNSYYSNEEGLVGQTLMDSLYSTIHKGFKQQSYSYVTEILRESDRVIGENKLNGIYNGMKLDINANNSQWNKEHVWPKSRLHSSNTTGPGADAHNLRASQIKINSVRGNDYFSEDSIKGEAHSISGSKTFYPGDDYKGDVARIGFYMATMYSNLGYKLTNDASLLNSGTRKYLGTLDLMLKWNKEDSVDAFEINRNNVIYKYQKNRNPFIDHPEFAHLIWEGKTIEELNKPPTKSYSNILDLDASMIMFI